MAGEWKVSVSSDSPQESAVVRSMLTLLQGDAQDRWQYSDWESADLRLVGGTDGEPEGDADGGRIVARLLNGETAPATSETLVLVRPLRAMPFLDFLNEAARRLRTLRGEADLESETLLDDETHPLLLAGKSLFQLRQDSAAGPVALVDINGHVMALVNVARATFTSPHDAVELAVRMEREFLRIETRSPEDWARATTQVAACSLDQLCWQLGKDLSRHVGLAPWLDMATPYRLMGWPDFGAIGADRTGFRFAALLTRRALTPAQASVVLGVTVDEVASFLNCASLCGLLAAGTTWQPGVQPSVQPSHPPAPERRSMIARLRTRLGL